MEQDQFLYHRMLLEDAFKRYEKGLKSIEAGSQILLERGELELKYALGLTQWMNKTREIVNGQGFDLCEGVRKLFLDAVEHADDISKIHQDVFYAFRDQDSPYHKIHRINYTRQARINRKIEVSKLAEEFKKTMSLKRSLEDCENRWLRVRDRYINDLKQQAESGLKVDKTNDKRRESAEGEIAVLQEKIENARKRYTSACKKHRVFKENQTKRFQEMYEDLETVERDRLSCTVNAFKRYHKITSISERMDSRMVIVDHLDHMLKLTSRIEVDKVVSGWHRRTEEAVRKALSNPTKSLMSILFENYPPERNREQNFGSDIGPRPNSPLFRDSTTLRYCESLVSRHDPVRVRPGKRQPAVSPNAPEKERSLMGAFYSSGSSCESISSVIQRVKPKVKTVKVTPAKETFESTSVSTLEDGDDLIGALPTSASDLPPTRPIQFCASPDEDVQDMEPVGLSKASAKVSLASQELCPEEFGHHITAVETAHQNDASCLANVKVRANRDFNSADEETLSFRKGQVIKQKVAKNNNGYCYGWTKSGRFAPKRYGFYPAECVSVYHRKR